MKKYMYELDLRELKKNYDYGDLSMLEYLKDFIPEKSKLNELYIQVLDYNEIFANGLTINEVFEMGKKDEYWTNRVSNFVKKYKVKESEYDNYSDFFDKYTELRDELLDKMGIDLNILEKDLSEITSKGIVEGEIITDIKKLNDNDSFTVARVLNNCHCVELHYDSGIATVEYGDKLEPDYWESEVEESPWFNKKMSEEEILNKLNQLFEEEYGKEEFYKGGNENEVCSML